MKTSPPLLRSFILLSLFSSFLLHGEAESWSTTVLDVHGNAVQSGVKYYASYQYNSKRGSFHYPEHDDAPCGSSVVEVGPNVTGDAMVFSPAVPTKHGAVKTRANINVEMFPSGANPGNCSDVWRISGNDPEDVDTAHYVVNGGVKGNPSSATAVNWFMIVKAVNGYKFRFCPVSLCDCNPVCQNIGFSVDKAGNWLVQVGNSLNPLVVNFVKA